MPISINTNVASMRSQRHLNRTMGQLRGSIERLSSGFRINSASDDAAGLAISEAMKSDIRSFQQARRNSFDAVSLLQTAEGGMDDITQMIHRMRELAIQSASDGVSNTQRAYIQTEVTELQSEIDRIAASTEYNDTLLLDGTLNADFQIGLDSGDAINITFATALDAAGLGVNAAAVTMGSKVGAVASLAALDGALDTLAGFRAEVGATQNRLDVISNNLAVQVESLSDANSRIRDADIAADTAEMTKSQILMQAGSSMLAQANSFPQVALSLLGG